MIPLIAFTTGALASRIVGARGERNGTAAETKLQEVAAEAEELRAYLAKESGNSDELRLKNEDLIRSVEALKAQATEMRRQNDGLRTENAELVSRTTELVDRLAAIKAEREDLADRLTRAEASADERVASLRAAVEGALSKFAQRACSLSELVSSLASLGLQLDFEEDQLVQALMSEHKRDPVELVLLSGWMARLREAVKDARSPDALVSPGTPGPLGLEGNPTPRGPATLALPGPIADPSRPLARSLTGTPRVPALGAPTPRPGDSFEARALRALASRGAAGAKAPEKASQDKGSGSPAATVVSPGERVPGRKPLAALGANTDAPSPIAKPDGKGGLTLTRTLEAAPVHGSARAQGGWGSFFGRQSSAPAARTGAAAVQGSAGGDAAVAPALPAGRGIAAAEKGLSVV